MASSSITEDRYGVVQKDLAQIIVTLLNLQQVSKKINEKKLFSTYHCLLFVERGEAQGNDRDGSQKSIRDARSPA